MLDEASLCNAYMNWTSCIREHLMALQHVFLSFRDCQESNVVPTVTTVDGHDRIFDANDHRDVSDIVVHGRLGWAHHRCRFCLNRPHDPPGPGFNVCFTSTYMIYEVHHTQKPVDRFGSLTNKTPIGDQIALPPYWCSIYITKADTTTSKLQRRRNDAY